MTHGQAEGEGHAEEADADVRDAGGEDRRTTPAEHQHEGPEELCGQPLIHRVRLHTWHSVGAGHHFSSPVAGERRIRRRAPLACRHELLDIIWFIFVSFAFIAYLMFMFQIIGDLFRDHTVSGWVKALWMICLIFFPFLTAIIYLIVRGKGMYERQSAAINQARASQEDYIRNVAAPASPADQISQAKGLLDSGAISQAEFDALKAKALS